MSWGGKSVGKHIVVGELIADIDDYVLFHVLHPYNILADGEGTHVEESEFVF